MITTAALLGFSLSLAAAAPPLRDLEGAEVDLRHAVVLVIDPTEADEVQATLEGLRGEGRQLQTGPIQHLTVVVDLSAVPGFLQKYAEGVLAERAEVASKRAAGRGNSLSWIADWSGEVSAELRGPLEGSCLVRLDARGKHHRGATVASLRREGP